MNVDEKRQKVPKLCIEYRKKTNKLYPSRSALKSRLQKEQVLYVAHDLHEIMENHPAQVAGDHYQHRQYIRSLLANSKTFNGNPSYKPFTSDELGQIIEIYREALSQL